MVRRSIWVGLAVLCMTFVYNPTPTPGQAVYGSIIGTVTDPQGGAVAGAKGEVVMYETTMAVGFGMMQFHVA